MRRKGLIRSSTVLAALALVLSGCENGDGDDTIRIGAMTSYNSLTLGQTLELDEELAESGTEIQWRPNFEAFVPALEAANGGEIDAGSGGLTNIFTGLADGGDFVVIGVENSAEAMGIVASADSGIKSIEDLAGHSIAVNQGGTGEYLARRALDRAEIDPSEVDIKYLTPADGISAFQSGSVDAIAVWDQYFATAQVQPGAHVVATGVDLESRNYLFHWVTHEYAESHPNEVTALVRGLESVSNKAIEQPEAVAEFYSERGADEQALSVISRWRPYDFEQIGEDQKELVEKHGQDLLDYGIIETIPDLSDAFFEVEGAQS